MLVKEVSRSPWRHLSPRNIGAIYVWVIIIVIFSLWMPRSFLQVGTPMSILNQSTVTAIVAMGVILPLAVGTFDLSIGAVMSFAAVTSAWLLGNTEIPVWLIVIITLGAGTTLGLINAFVILKMKIDSFIGTLATGSIIGALALGVSQNKLMTEGVAGAFSKIATGTIFGIPYPVYYMLILMLVLAFILERTKTGRFMYASGFGPEAARLAGVNVVRLKLIALLASSFISSFAGIVLLGRIQAADATIGISYLLPAFSAVFLGATQFRNGRFNSWGTVVAVLMLQTGSFGLLLSGIAWAPQVFQGVVLLAAVGITVVQRKVKPVKKDLPTKTEIMYTT
jgi:ribose transport system permease protein